jgi:hypothetical protein
LGQTTGKTSLFLLDLPSIFAADGVLIDLVSNLHSDNPKLIIVSLTRLLMLYHSRYPLISTKEDLAFFLQKVSINFSPEAKEYFSLWSQQTLRLHFNTKYSEECYLSPNYFNPAVELAQI